MRQYARSDECNSNRFNTVGTNGEEDINKKKKKKKKGNHSPPPPPRRLEFAEKRRKSQSVNEK